MATRLPAGSRVTASDAGAGQVDHLVDVVALDQAVTAEHGAIGSVCASQRRRVRGRRPHACVRSADFGGDDGDAGTQRFFGNPPESLGILHILEQQDQGLRLALVEHVFGNLHGFQARLVAGADDIAECHFLGAATIEEGKADAAALRQHRDLSALGAGGQERTRRCLHGWTEGRAQGRCRVGKTLRVGADDGQVIALGNGSHFSLQPGAIAAAGLGKSGAEHDRRFHSGAAAALQFLRDVRGRDNQHSQVGPLRQVADRGIGLAPRNFAMAARHRIDLTLERMARHGVHDATAQALRIG